MTTPPLLRAALATLSLHFAIFGWAEAPATDAAATGPVVQIPAGASGPSEGHRYFLPDWEHDLSDIPAHPQVEWSYLPNGVRIALLPHNEPPDRVTLRLVVQTGSLMEDDDQQGMAHFLEHMAFNGSQNFPAGEMIEYFQRLGMAFGPDTNAHTSWRETVYKLEMPKADLQYLRDGIRLFRDYADGMLLGEAEIEKERGIILAEKLARDSVGLRTFVAITQWAMPEARLGFRLPIGLDETIRTMPRSRFQDFYRRWYTADRLTVVAVGAIDPAQLYNLVEEYFGTLPGQQTPTPDPDLGKVTPRGLEAFVYRDAEAPNVTVSLGFPAPWAPSVDTWATRRAETVRGLASAIVDRRLQKLAQAEGAPFTSGTTYVYPFLDFLYNTTVELETKPELWQATLAVAENELRRSLEHGFGASELDEARANFLESYRNAAKEAPTRKSRQLADALVDAVSEGRVFSDEATELAWAEATLPGITVAEVEAAWRALFADREPLIAVSGNLAEDVPTAAVLDAYRAATATPVAPYAVAETTPWAYTQFGQPGEVVARLDIADLGITQLRFANGVRVNLKPTDFEQGTIRLLARFGGGQLVVPTTQPALAVLAPSIINLGGLGEHSVDDLQRLLAGRTVGLGFAVGEDSFRLSGRTTPADLELQLQLLAAGLSDPGWRPEAERLAKRSLDALYQQLRHTLEGVMNNEVDVLLASGDPRFGYPERAAVEALNTADVRAWLEEPMRRAALEVNLVGEFTIEGVLPLLAATVGALPAREQEPDPLTAARALQFPAATSVTFRYPTQIPRTAVMAAFPTEDSWNIQRARRLGVLASILGDRLRLRVREETGSSYSPGAWNAASDTFADYGYLAAQIECNPEQVETVWRLFDEIVADLHAGNISEDEFARAQAPRMPMLRENIRNNNYWLGSVLARSQQFPARLDWPRHILTDNEAITRDELIALARQYLDPARLVRINILPELTESEGKAPVTVP